MIEEHLIRWLEADKKIFKAKQDIAGLEAVIKDAELEANDARLSIQQEMAETGEFEINIGGEYFNYRIYFPTARESVKVENSNAVPDEFCKIERKPKLKEIKEHIDLGNHVNWACIEQGTPKLTYKLTKKG
jgi:hypothetical protein